MVLHVHTLHLHDDKTYLHMNSYVFDLDLKWRLNSENNCRHLCSSIIHVYLHRLHCPFFFQTDNCTIFIQHLHCFAPEFWEHCPHWSWSGHGCDLFHFSEDINKIQIKYSSLLGRNSGQKWLQQGKCIDKWFYRYFCVNPARCCIIFQACVALWFAILLSATYSTLTKKKIHLLHCSGPFC